MEKSSFDMRIDAAFNIKPEPQEKVVVDLDLYRLMSLLYGGFGE